MKIIIKSLKGELLDLQVQPTDSILSLKNQYQQIKGVETNKQKLIYKGQMVEDQKTIQEYNIQEGDFIVIMISQAKPQQLPIQPTQQPSQPQQQPQSQPLPQQQPQSNQQARQEPQQQVSQGLPNQQDNALLHGEAANAAINEMVSMGFPKEECLAAMRAAFNNPERAIDYLLNGIPQNIQQPQQPQQPQQVPQQQAPQQSQQGEQNLSQILNSPEIQQFRALIHQNPQVLQNPQLFSQVLGMLQQTNPQLLQMIQQNPQIIQQILFGGQEENQNQPQNMVYVTQEEMNNIDQIVSLGFTKQQAIEAYISCDKNVEMATAFLFDQADQDQQFQQVNQQPPQQAQQTQPKKDTDQQQDQKKDENKKDQDKKDDDPDDSVFS